MICNWIRAALLSSALLVPVFGQSVHLESLDRLKAKASGNVTISLDASLLQLASRFLSDDDADQRDIRKLVAGLKRISVRNFQFDRDGDYSIGDVDAIRNQLRDPGWSKLVEVRNRRDDNADVYLRQDGKNVSGAVVIVAEPRELTVVSFEGLIDMDGIAKLAGKFGIPDSVRIKVERRGK
ncbi:MAG: DUF4252 domain-containing protein [Bryobacteraceae bacterium]